MRVVAGTCRGRRLQAPPGTTTRPTSDRARESVFNSLRSLDPEAPRTVLDLFAGSGAMGIEALSRGAQRAVFVESDRVAATTIRTNLEACGFSTVAEVVVGPVERFLAGSIVVFDLVIADPPYGFDEWPELASSIRGRTLVAESDRAIELGTGWEFLRQRAHGGTVVTIASAIGREPADPQERLQ